MRRLLVLQHVPYEILGTLDPLLRDAGFRIRYVNFGRDPQARPDISRYHGLVILGGPMNCDQCDRYPHLDTEIELIQQAIADGKPVLGICLGAQLIARALGARVRKNPVKEIGWYALSPTADGLADPLFSRLASTQMIFQWHGDTFDIPEHAQRLASSPDCPNQAFRYGENVYGLQFHLEVDQPMIHRWLHAPVNLRELQSLGDADTRIPRIKADTARYIGHSRELGKTLFGAYIRLFHQRRRRIALPSR
jgi:GMP synthase (glutamine-hydrolysing)